MVLSLSMVSMLVGEYSVSTVYNAQICFLLKAGAGHGVEDVLCGCKIMMRS